MTFLWPQNLWLFAVLPLLVAAYVWVMRRKKKAALRYAGLGLVKQALGQWRASSFHVSIGGTPRRTWSWWKYSQP